MLRVVAMYGETNGLIGISSRNYILLPYVGAVSYGAYCALRHLMEC